MAGQVLPSPGQLAALLAVHSRRQGVCRLWTAGKTKNGYGTTRSLTGRTAYVHRRLVLEVRIGRALRPGEEARHTCDRPSCVEASHLIPGSRLQNVLDATVKDLAKELTRVDVVTMRGLYAGGITFAELGRRFGVSAPAARYAVRGRTWRWLSAELV